MICQTSVLDYARFFALRFPRERLAFSRRDIIETNLQDLNIPSRVLCAGVLLSSLLCAGWSAARVFTFPAPRRSDPGRETGHPSPALLPPRPPPRPIGRQVGPHLRDNPPLPSAPLAAPRGLAGPLRAPGPPRSARRRYAQVTGTECALSPPLAARIAGGLVFPACTRLLRIARPPPVRGHTGPR